MGKMLDLVKQMDELNRERKKLMSELPRNYVMGSEAYKKQVQKIEGNYQADTQILKNKINMELAKVEAKAKTIQTIHATNSAPTMEEIESGYKIIDVISKTSNSISEDTLTRLVGKVKDFDQLAVIQDVVAATGEIALKNIVKNRIQVLDEINMQQQNQLQLVKDFDEALAQSNDELTFDVMALAAALDNNE